MPPFVERIRAPPSIARLIVVLKWLGGAFLLPFLALIAKAVWDWLSTLHH